MANTITDFSNYFAPGKRQAVFNLYEAIDHARSFLDPLLKKHGIDLEIRKHDGPRPALFLGNENEFGQVILNLVKNGIDAIKETNRGNGAIRLRVSENGGHWTIAVEDDGGGVPPEVMDRIFEPYFTTKFKSQGTGIGLYMARMIVEESLGGKITVENVDKGALFTLTLPKREDKGPNPQAPEPEGGSHATA